jgi:hypothetical protein
MDFKLPDQPKLQVILVGIGCVTAIHFYILFLTEMIQRSNLLWKNHAGETSEKYFAS